MIALRRCNHSAGRANICAAILVLAALVGWQSTYVPIHIVAQPHAGAISGIIAHDAIEPHVHFEARNAGAQLLHRHTSSAPGRNYRLPQQLFDWGGHGGGPVCAGRPARPLLAYGPIESITQAALAKEAAQAGAAPADPGVPHSHPHGNPSQHSHAAAHHLIGLIAVLVIFLLWLAMLAFTMAPVAHVVRIGLEAPPALRSRAPPFRGLLLYS